MACDIELLGGCTRALVGDGSLVKFQENWATFCTVMVGAAADMASLPVVVR